MYPEPHNQHPRNQHRRNQYLQKYAEAETRLLHNWPGNRYRRVLVIPCYREEPEFLRRLLWQFSKAHLLLILVMNRPDNDTDTQGNHALLNFVETLPAPVWQNDHLSLRLWGNACGLLLANRCGESQRIPRKQGVGLARKIGCDLAARLMHDGLIESRWIHSSDADARLPADYFAQLPEAHSASAALYPFAHDDGDSLTHRALQLYEKALHQYVDGLRRAGSPWAFHTIGSTLAISADFYCAARGFPKKSAGEDFYLLNKLAKLAPVVQLHNRQPIRLAARLSDRVPFGTGPATARIAHQLEQGEAPLWYAPAVFDELRGFLDSALQAEEQSSRWHAALEELGWPMFVAHCQRQKLTGRKKEEAFHYWFDAFRTLRFIHLMQRQWHPPRPLR